ncbi:MAG: BMP family ABC transporter substrate-binding protein [Mycoplasma sp.]
MAVNKIEPKKTVNQKTNKPHVALTKRVKSNIFKNLKTIIASTLGISAIGASSGLVLGLTAAYTKTTSYLSYTPWQKDQSMALAYRTFGDPNPEKNDHTSSYWSNPLDNQGHKLAEPVNASTYQIYNQVKMDNTTLNAKDPNQLFKYCGLIIDGSKHEVKDYSFNQSQYNGLINWVHQKRLGWSVGEKSKINIATKVENPIGFDKPADITGINYAKAIRPTGDTTLKFEESYDTMFNDPDHVKTAILSGYLHHDSALNGTAKYPSKGFMIVDSIVPKLNAASIQARSDQGAFLAGMSACQFLQDNYDAVYSKINGGKLSVATFGGIAIHSVTAFMGGFELGVWTYNHLVLPKLPNYSSWSEELKEKRTVGLIDMGQQDSFFTNSFSIGDANTITREMLAKGADVILPVAGPQTIDVIKEVQSEHSAAVVIGVDVAQEDTPDGQTLSTSPLWKGKERKIMLCSVVRETELLISMMLQASAKGIRGYKVNPTATTFAQKFQEISWDGNPASGSFIGTYGYVTIGDISNYGVNVSPAGQENFKKALNYILSSSEQASTYEDALNKLNSKQLVNSQNPESTTGADKTLVEMINENPYFYF